MKKIAFLMLMSSVAMFAQIPGLQWQKSLGGTASDFALGITETTDGNYVVAGCTDSNNGDVAGNHGQTDIWLVKLTPDGDIIWKKTFGGTQKDLVEYVSPTSDGGVVITGATFSNNGDIPASPNPPDRNILAAKFDANGNTVWVKNFVGLNGQSIEPTSDGGYLLSGMRYSPPGINVSYDALLIKLDMNGSVEWENTYGTGGLNPDLASRAYETSDGNFIFGGSTIFGHNGQLGPITTMGAGVWIVKVSNQGTLIWQRLYSSSEGFDDFNDIIETEDGGFMVACSSPGTGGNKSESFGSYDAWVLKLDGVGNLIWEKSYGGVWKDRTNALFRTPEGNYMIGGLTNTNNDGDIAGFIGGDDYWLIEIDAEGTLLGQKTYGGLRNDYLFSFFQTTDNSYLMAGSSYSNDADVFGNHSATPNDFWSVTDDFWVVKIGNMPDVSFCGGTNNAMVNLTQATSILQQSLPSAVISYYTSAEDANAGINAIENPQSFTVTLGSMVIFVRIQTSGEQWHINNFTLIETVPVQLPQLPALTLCGTPEAVFDLTVQEAMLSEAINLEEYTIAYYTSAEDAQNGINAITTPESFVAETGQVIYVKVSNIKSNCDSVTEFSLIISPAPILPQFLDLTSCPLDNTNEGIFNLTQQELLITQPGITLSYYLSAEDANANSNVIANATTFTNTVNPQTIFVRVSNSECSSVSSFTLEIIPMPEPVIIPQLSACPPVDITTAVTANTNGLQFTYYTSAADAAATVNTIANPQAYNYNDTNAVIYVRAQSSEGCFSVNTVALSAHDCEIPRGISPNGDEENDNFDLTYIDVQNIVIFNRYGLEMYSQNNYTNQWHGQTSKGSDLPTGVYYYFLHLKDGRNKTGWVYLNR